MPDGFSVNPAQLDGFSINVSGVATEYGHIVDWLAEARLSDKKMTKLLSHPEDLGTSGPPVEFAKSSKTLLNNYSSLLETPPHQVHVAVHTQFDRMHKELKETSTLYGTLDDKHAATFQSLFGNLETDGV